MNIKNVLKDTIIREVYHDLLHLIPDRVFVSVQYHKKLGKWPNLNNPLTFNEKLNWIKIHNRDPKLSLYCDKYLVRDYVAESIGQKYLIPLIGVYNSFDEIDFSILPDRFVIKASHDSGSVVICNDKRFFDPSNAKIILESALKRNYYYVDREWPYKNVKPRLLVEELLDEHIVDYKFYVFNGKPEYLYLGKGLVRDHSLKIAFFDMEGKLAPFGRKDYPTFQEKMKMPASFEEMKKIASTLANGLPFVRVDLYSVNNVIYFSEMTLTPAGGYTPFYPEEYDKVLGDMIIL